MPLFYESLESIAQAVVTVKRALKAGVIEKEDYKGLNDYLAQRVKDFKIKKTHLAKANKDLDIELELEAEEFFTDEGDALCNMAADLLEDFNDFNREDVKPAVDKQAAACAAWMKMDDEERAAMAALASAWQR
jgi:hypothetical protein